MIELLLKKCVVDAFHVEILGIGSLTGEKFANAPLENIIGKAAMRDLFEASDGTRNTLDVEVEVEVQNEAEGKSTAGGELDSGTLASCAVLRVSLNDESFWDSILSGMHVIMSPYVCVSWVFVHGCFLNGQMHFSLSKIVKNLMYFPSM